MRQPGAWSCIVAAGAISDYDQSGGFPITFGPGPTPTLPPQPTLRTCGDPRAACPTPQGTVSLPYVTTTTAGQPTPPTTAADTPPSATPPSGTTPPGTTR
jgi:hypothetical protein